MRRPLVILVLLVVFMSLPPLVQNIYEKQSTVEAAIQPLYFRTIEDVRPFLDKLLSTDQNNLGALIARGEVDELVGNLLGAVEWYDKAVSHDSNNVTALIHQAKTLFHLGRYADAIDSYDRVLNIHPNDTDVLMEKGTVLDAFKKYEDATDLFDRVLSIDPNNTQAYIKKAGTLQAQGHLEDAIELYDTVIGRADLAYKERINALMSKEALIHINIPAENEARINALMSKGSALTTMGRNNEALEIYYKVASEVSSGHVCIGQSYQVVEAAADILDTLGRHEERDKFLKSHKLPVGGNNCPHELDKDPFYGKEFLRAFVCANINVTNPSSVTSLYPSASEERSYPFCQHQHVRVINLETN